MIVCQGIKAKFLSETDNIWRRLRNDVCKSSTVSVWFSGFCFLGVMSLAAGVSLIPTWGMGSQRCWPVSFNRCQQAKRRVAPGCWFPWGTECHAWVVVCSAPWRLFSVFALSRNAGTLLEVTGQQNMLTICLKNGPGWKQPGDHPWESV